jgi:hypothetical protein
VRVGDIVRLANRGEGLWIFAGPRPGEIPTLTMGKFVRATGEREAITLGIESATLVATPVFTPGDTVTHQNEPHIVESDGESNVVLTYGPRQVAVPPRDHAGEHFTHSGRVFADRAQLVRENLHKFIS